MSAITFQDIPKAESMVLTLLHLFQGGQAEPDGDCAAGYFCKKGAETDQPFDSDDYGICPEGSYCETGTDTPVPCPVGTFGFVCSSFSVPFNLDGDCDTVLFYVF